MNIMQDVYLRSVNDFIEWRAAARTLLRAGIPPSSVTWADPAAPGGLFEAPAPFVPPAPDRPAGRAPLRFATLARSAICHRDPERFALLYRLLWRLQKDRAILGDLSDLDTGKLNRRVEDVAREVQRMQKELHFYRAVSADGHHGVAALFEPKHNVLELVAPQFARIHRDTDFRIATPYRCCWWDRKALTFGPGASPPARADRTLYAASASVDEKPPGAEPPRAVSFDDSSTIRAHADGPKPAAPQGQPSLTPPGPAPNTRRASGWPTPAGAE